MAVGGGFAGVAQAATLNVWGTSDVSDSNLLAHVIVPGFASFDPSDTISYTAVGSGAAITEAETPANGVDAIMVHSPSLEAPFVSGGHSVEPLGRAIFYNDYVIVGPSSDPAGVDTSPSQAANAAGAFQRIAAAGGSSPSKATFLTRNDASGTNVEEEQIWGLTTGVTIQPALNGSASGRFQPGSGGTFPAWYVPTNAQQGQNLIDTNECVGGTGPVPNGNCYTIVDRGTYYYEQSLGNTSHLAIVAQNNAAGSPGGLSLLTNPFHAYIPQMAPHLTGATAFLNYLTSSGFQNSLPGFPGSGKTSVYPDAYANISSSTIPTHAASGSTFTISATLQYAPPVPQNIVGMPVTLESDPGCTGSYAPDASVTNPQNTNGSGVVSFTPTIGSVMTCYQLSMSTYDDTSLTTVGSQFSPNDNTALGPNNGQVNVP
jgi:tungstate transport system substrate-binding protein